ncbi:MAG: YncE family protein [Anaerolineae bacterium]|nr:YncE family protein [Anaerolineae bacterium]
MRKLYKISGIAIMLAILTGMLFVFTVSAGEKTPPYVVAMKSTGDSSNPSRVAVDAITRLAYVLDTQYKLWIFEDADDPTFIAMGRPVEIAVDPGHYIYVTSDIPHNPVSIVHGTEKFGTIPLGIRAAGAVAVLTSTHRAYAALPDDNVVVVLDGSSLTITSEITVGQNPVAIAANPSNDQVYVVNRDDHTVSIIKNGMVIYTATVGITPTHVAVNPVTNYAYVSNSGDNTVTVIAGDTHATNTIAVGDEPGDIAINTRLGDVYVINEGTIGSLSVLRDTTLLQTKSLPDSPRAVDVNPATGYIYVVGGEDDAGTITVLSATLASETYVPIGHAPHDIAVLPGTEGDLAYAAMYKGTGGDDEGRVVILGRSEATRVILENGKPATMICDGVNALSITLQIPAQTITENVDLICSAWEPNTQPHYQFAGQGFILKAYQQGQHRAGFEFMPVITMGVNYPQPHPASLETELELRLGVPGGDWTTAGITLISPPAHNKLTVTLRHLPADSLAGYAIVIPGTFIYLPLIMRNA